MISSSVSALADAALLLPAAVLVLFYLALLREGRLMLAFAVSLGAAAVTTILLKLVLHACGHTITDVRVISPSGHVSFGTVFYGALAIMLATGHGRHLRLLAAIGTVILLLAIGISRVRVGAHSIPEVMIGFAIGGAAVALFAALHRWSAKPRLPWVPVVGGFAVALLMLGGSHFSLERNIAGYARRMASSLDVCAPVTGRSRERYSSVRH